MRAAAASMDLKANGSKPKKKQVTLNQLLLMKASGFGGLGPSIVEHCVVTAGLQANLKLKTAAELTKQVPMDQLQTLVDELLLERLQSEQISNLPKIEEGSAEAKAPTAVQESSTANDDKATGAKHGFIILKEHQSESQF